MSTQPKTMKAVTFASIGAPPTITTDIPIPTPSEGQLLVKSLYTAINPVDSFMSSSGMLVQSFPMTLGCDASGLVVESKSTKFQVHDKVFGCTRLGTHGYGTAATYHLFDADVAIPTPSNINDAQAATLGVGMETALLGIVNGLHVNIDEVIAAVDGKAQQKDEWVVVLGGASSVGKYAVQVLLATGYHVIASCSKSSTALVESLGAKTFDYKDSIDKQVKNIMHITAGKVRRVFDAVASADPVVAKELFDSKLNLEGGRFFTTTNDWSGITDFGGGKTYPILLGPVGRPEAKELNKQVGEFVPIIHGLVKNGKVKPNEYELVGDGKGGLEDAIEALQFQQSGKGGNRKVVAKIGED